MISEHMKACDDLIESAEKMVHDLADLPFSRFNIEASIRANDFLDTAREYKKQTLNLYDKMFAFMGSAVQ